MSNYLAVVAGPELLPRVRSWLAARGSVPSEQLHATLGAGHELVVVSRDAAGCALPGAFFRGTAVSADEDTVVFGARGWADAPQAVVTRPERLTGEFVLVSWTPERVTVRRDATGSVAMAWTSADGFVAASDSLLVLADLRRSLGLPVTPAPDVLVARAFPNGMAIQQVSDRTQVREIGYVPTGRHLELDVPSLSTRLGGTLLADELLDEGRSSAPDEVATTRRAAVFLVRTMTALARRDDIDARLRLSGGYDSRVLLGAALRGGAAHRLPLEVAGTTQTHLADRAASAPLVERYGLTANGPRRALAPATPLPPLATFASSTLGFYDIVASAYEARAGVVAVGGVGAGLLKGGWGWRPTAAMLPDNGRFPDEYAALSEELAAGVRVLGGDPRWSDASELLYAGTRNGLHGAGIGIATTMTSLRPLNVPALARLGHARTDGRPAREDREHAKVYGAGPFVMAGLLALMDPELAVMPYESADKALSPALVADRLAALGGPLGSEADGEATLLGHPRDVPAGPSALGIGVAEHLGLSGPLDGPTILALAQRALDEVDDDVVRAAYDRHRRAVRLRLVERGEEPRNAGPALGKVLTLVGLTAL